MVNSKFSNQLVKDSDRNLPQPLSIEISDSNKLINKKKFDIFQNKTPIPQIMNDNQQQVFTKNFTFQGSSSPQNPKKLDSTLQQNSQQGHIKLAWNTDDSLRSNKNMPSNFLPQKKSLFGTTDKLGTDSIKEKKISSYSSKNFKEDEHNFLSPGYNPNTKTNSMNSNITVEIVNDSKNNFSLSDLSKVEDEQSQSESVKGSSNTDEEKTKKFNTLNNLYFFDKSLENGRYNSNLDMSSLILKRKESDDFKIDFEDLFDQFLQTITNQENLKDMDGATSFNSSEEDKNNVSKNGQFSTDSDSSNSTLIRNKKKKIHLSSDVKYFTIYKLLFKYF